MFQKSTLIIALFAALTLTCCAKMDSIDTIDLSDESFTDWVANHDKQAQPLNKDSLVFRKFLKHGAADAQILDPGKYVYLNYTMSTLDGTYFVSRDSLIGRLTGTWSKTTHWCDDFMQFYDKNGFFCPGIYDGIKGLRSGDSVRLYISGVAAYNSGYLVSNSGYMSSKQSNYIGFPIICDIKIGDITTNPARAAIDAVDKYAAEKWGLTTKDSLKTGLYARVIKSNPTGEEITTEVTVPILYKQTFPDGFLLGTNSDSIAKVYNRYDTNGAYGVIYVSPKGGSNYDSFYSYVLPKHKMGDVLEVITIPFYTTLGNTGSFSTTPQLLSYQPTVFTVITKVAKKADAK